MRRRPSAELECSLTIWEGKAFTGLDESLVDDRVELYLACARSQKARVGGARHAHSGEWFGKWRLVRGFYLIPVS